MYSFCLRSQETLKASLVFAVATLGSALQDLRDWAVWTQATYSLTLEWGSGAP